MEEVEAKLRESEPRIEEKINIKVLIGSKTVIAQIVGKLRMLAGQVFGII